MQALIGPLKGTAEFEEICKKKMDGPGMLKITGCVSSQKTHMMYALGDGCPYKVIACSSETKAKQVYEEYRFLSGETYLYPAKDLLFYQADLRNKALVKERDGGAPGGDHRPSLTVVTSFDAFMDVLLPREVLADRAIRDRSGQHGGYGRAGEEACRDRPTIGKPRSKARANSPCGAGSWTSIL